MHRVDVRRFRLGLHGLALLRGWPLEDAADADEHMRAIARLLEEAPEFHELADPGLLAAYELWAETYDTPPNLLIEAEEPLVRSLLEGLDGEIALDAACGTGRLSRLLQERGFDVIAVDASAPMLERARRSEAAPFLAVADLARLPLRSESMDVVVCGLAMTHLGRLEDAIAELARVSRRHATLVVSDIHPVAVATGGQAFFTAADGSRRLARNHVHWPSAYAGAFHAAGLVIDRLEEIFVDEEFLQTMATPQVRADAGALLGLPLVLAWRLRKA